MSSIGERPISETSGAPATRPSSGTSTLHAGERPYGAADPAIGERPANSGSGSSIGRRPTSVGAVGPIIPGSTFEARFVDNRYYDGTLTTFSNMFTVSRASSALAQNVDNSWTTFSANQARLTTNGLLIESARTQSIRNSSAGGAVPGTPGTPPTNWSISAGGGSSSIIGSGTEAGIPYVDIRIFGTFAGSPSIQYEPSTQIAAASGQTWTTSQFMRVVGGSQTNVTNFSSRIFERNSSGTALANSATNFNPDSTKSLGGNRFSHTRVLNQATTAFVTGRLEINTNGSAIDITIRVGAPQNEQGAMMSSPILTTNATATRAADNITVTGTAAKAAIYAAQSSYSETILTVYSGTQNVICNINTGLMQYSSANQTQITNGTDTETVFFGAGVLSMLIKSAFSFDGVDLNIITNGGSGGTAGGWGISSGTITVGNNAALTRGLFGYLQNLAFSATAYNFDQYAQNDFTPSVSYTGGSQTRIGQAIGWYNFDGTYGQQLRTKLQSQSSWTLLCIGDSTTEGISNTNLRSQSWPSRLAANLITKGWNTSTDNFMGDANQGTTGNYLSYNGKINNFGVWNISGVESMGGKAFSTASTSTPLQMANADAFTAVDVLTIGTGFTEDVRFNGVSGGTITPVVQPKLTRINGTNSPAQIACSAGTAFVTGMILRNGSVNRIDIVNAGRGSSGTAFWTDNSSASRAIFCIPVLAADVVFIDLLIGDWGDSSGVSASTTKANLDTIINAIIGYGGIPVFISPHPTPTSIASASRQATWTDQNYDLADQYGIPIIDLHAWLGNDYNNAVAAGYTYDVSSHYNTTGYQAEADFIAAGLYFLAT